MRKIALVFLFVVSSFALNTRKAIAAERALVGTTEVYQTRGEGANQKNCNFFNSCLVAGQEIQVNLKNIAYSNGIAFPDGEEVEIKLTANENNCGNWSKKVVVQNSSISTTISSSAIRAQCSYKLSIKLPKNAGGLENTEESEKIYGSTLKASLQCSTDENECNTNLSLTGNYDLCKQQIAEGTDEFTRCQECFDKEGIWTAVGCVPRDPKTVVGTVITIGLTLGGGVVLIMILAGSFMLSTSQGDPNKTKEAKEIITSAIIGLLFMIFSVTILQFIGVSVLHIPGFGE